MKHFQLNEFVVSAMAKANKIDNTPTESATRHINEMVDNLLDPLREAWAVYCANEHIGTPALRVLSGYRCPQLNKMVGGSPTSAHAAGYAADIVPENGRLLEFKRFAREWLQKTGRKFDQMISEDEDGKGVPQWVHFGYKRPNGDQRKAFKSYFKKQYIPMTK